MSEEIVEGFKTSCKTCIFAEGLYKQTGCQLGRLEKFLEQGRANIDQESPDYYVINTICNTCRGEEWKNNNIGTNLVATVQREIQIGVDIVLYDVNSIDKINWKLEQTINACVKQRQIKPKKIIVVVKSDTANYRELYDILQELTEPYDVPFQLVRVIEPEADVGRCVEMGIDKCSSQFVAVFDLEYKIPSNLLTRLNTTVNYDLQQVIMVEPTFQYSGLIITRKVFKMLGKNYNFPIFEKIKEVAQDQDNEQLIFTWDTLWNHE